MTKRLIFKFVKISLPLLLGFYLLWFFFQQMDKSQLIIFYNSIAKANYWWILFALILSFLSFVIRAERWKLNLEALGYKSKFTSRYHALMIGYLMNFTIPRIGEATRSMMLFNAENIPFSKSFGTIISERIVDLFFLGILFITTYFMNVGDFDLILTEIQTAFGLTKKDIRLNYISLFLETIILIVVLLYIVLPTFRVKFNTFIKGIVTGVSSVLKLRNYKLYFTYSLLIWLLYVVHFYICFFSLSETSSMSINNILLAFIAGSVGIIFTNGGIGSFPLLIGIVIGIVGKDSIDNAHTVGNALGMLIWISETLLVVILGIISLILLPKPFKNGFSKEVEK